ncbi:glyoxalase [Burkholderia sp. AW49-1]
MYRDAFALSVLARFDDRDGYYGVMPGCERLDYHFEFAHCPAHPVATSPTAQDLIAFDLPDCPAWEAACARAAAHGCMRVTSFNPFGMHPDRRPRTQTATGSRCRTRNGVGGQVCPGPVTY